MVRLFLVCTLCSSAMASFSQTYLYKAMKMTECIISNEEFKSMDDIMDIEKIKSFDDGRQIVTRDSMSDFQVTLTINESAREGKMSLAGNGEVQRVDVTVMGIEELSSETKRYKYQEEKFKDEKYGEYVLVHDERGAEEDFILLYSEEEVREEFEGAVMFVILENISSAKLK